MFAFVSYFEVTRINIIREEGSTDQPKLAFMRYLAVTRITIIREEGSGYSLKWCFLSYLQVKGINCLCAERSTYHPTCAFMSYLMVKHMNIFGRKEQRINHKLLSAVACSPKYKYDSRGRIKVGTKLRYHELFFNHVWHS